MKRYTLADIKTAENKYTKAFVNCEKMKATNPAFVKQCNKVNRLLRNYRKIKGLFFGGNN